MSNPSASATITVAVPPSSVYALVSDLPGMARLASEYRGGRWLGSPGVVGARFRGHNRRGWRRWSTTVTITDAAPDQCFGFDVHFYGLPIAHWEYRLSATDAGCEVTESTWDRRPAWFKPIGGFATGSMNRAEVNQQHIEETLDRLKTTLEG